jgi:hypothetical protein
MATRQRLSINATAYVLSYAIIGEKMKVNNFEIITKKTGVSDVDLIKKLMNKLKRYGITSKNYYIYHSCIEHEYSNFTISASIKSEYIELYCKTPTHRAPAKYTIEQTVRAYTAQHALIMLNRNMDSVIKNKHYEYYTITNDELMHHE